MYSLGSTLFVLLTGRSPFPGTAAQKMADRQVRGVPRPSEVNPAVPRELDAIVQKMGAKDPHERFQTAGEVVAALHPWLPVAQWVALGHFAENRQPLTASRASLHETPAAPAKAGGFLASIKRLFGR